MSTQNQLNILGVNALPINNTFVIRLEEENIDSIDYETKRRSKILTFSTKLHFNEILKTILKLDPKSYPNLFIFVIEEENIRFFGSNVNGKSEKVEILLKILLEFGENRPIVLQLKSNVEKLTKIYYKEQNSADFLVINGRVGKMDDFEDFPTFLQFCSNKKIRNFEKKLLKKSSQVKNFSLIIRFLRALELPEEFLINLIKKCAEGGKEFDLLAALDTPLDNEYKDPENILSWMFDSTSVLHIAVQNYNQEIINLLVKKFTISIKLLPVDHQVEISTAAFSTNQLEVLCDLLEFVDFPFPSGLNINSITNKRLLKIIDVRLKFHEDVLAQNINEIELFAATNSQIKFAYNLDNKSAFCHALDSKKFRSFFLLQSLRFEDNEIEHYESKLSNDKDKKKASKLAAVQRRENVSISIPNKERTILLLSMRSFIYNRNSHYESEGLGHEIIKNWYKDIYKTKFGSKLLDTAAQCGDFKIVFDFECDSVKNVDVSQASGSLGTTYPQSKFIFVGAKLSGEKEREQMIKGVLAHEICHYVMRLVYQNKDSPFFKEDREAAEKFGEIVSEIKAELFPLKSQQKEPEMDDIEKNEAGGQLEEDDSDDNNKEEEEEIDDGCDGIISTVYKYYAEQDHIAELIVRPFHIQAQFDDKQEKLTELEKKYENLFKFCENFVIPELEKYNLTERKEIQNFNNLVSALPEIQDSRVKLSELRDMNDLLNSQLVIATTNVPKLLLLNIYEHLNQKCELELMSAQNIFVTARDLKNEYISKKFQEVSKLSQTRSIFVDCSKGFGKNFDLLILDDKSKFMFIVSNEDQCENLSKKMNQSELNPTKVTLNYNWMDLTAESQKILLQNKVSFQNDSNFTLAELIVNEMDPQQEVSARNFTEVIDDQLLSLLLEKEKILINPLSSEEIGDNHFRILFQTRNLIRNFERIKPAADEFEKIDKSDEISQDEMFQNVKSEKFVLISDKAGSGKSWMLKNFTKKLRELFPKKWITYVDLKQFIDEFKSQKAEGDFSAFMTDKILKLNTKYEAEIFKQLYKNGKICIIFDGFDEIAPDCAENVLKLFQLFHQNNGNQLWIATRDYFEVNLKKKLNVDVVYRLDEFTEKHGIDLIAKSWMLDDMKLKVNEQLESDIISYINSSPDLQNYKDIAAQISKKISELQTNSIGFPQFYKMIADIFRNSKNSVDDFTIFKMFEKCVDIQYSRWSDEKGKLRKNESIESMKKELKYHELHQLIAMESFFPNESKFCDLDRANLKEWLDEEIIACGLLSKKGGKFFFSHETFREFYAAKFIIRALENGKMDGLKYFIEFITTKKFGIIRMFLNEAFGRKSFLDKIQTKMQKIAEIFLPNVKKLENLSHIFVENLENLADFLLQIFKLNKDYEQIKQILFANNKIFKPTTKNKSLFVKVPNFIEEYLNPDDLENFVAKNKTTHSILSSGLTAEGVKLFFDKTKNETDFKSAMDESQAREYGENLLFDLIKSNHGDENVKKLEGMFEIISPCQIIKLTKQNDKDGMNILHACVKTGNEKKIKFLWNKLEQIFVYQNIHHEFKELIGQDTLYFPNGNILHVAAVYCDKTEFHETLWELLLKTFENREELKNLMMQNNFLGCQIRYGSETVVEFDLNKIKEAFSDDQYQEILYSKGYCNRNLLQGAASESQNVKTHQILWRTFRNLCTSAEKFLEIFKEVDIFNDNILHIAASSATVEIFEFMFNQLEEITTHEEIGKLLLTKGLRCQNLLQRAAEQNKSSKLHEILWKIIRKYFSQLEIFEMIMDIDDIGNNILNAAVKLNVKEAVEQTCIEIRNSLKCDGEGDVKLLELSDECRKYISNFMIDILDDKSKHAFEAKLDEFIKRLKIIDANKIFLKIQKQEISIKDCSILHRLAFCDNIEYHEALWEILLESFDDKSELKDLILQEDIRRRNFAHRLILNDNSEIIELTFKKIKDTFQDIHYEVILKSEGYEKRSLLQAALYESKDIKAHQILWKILRDFYKSDEEFLRVLKEVDSEDKNIFHLAASFSTSEIFEFMIQELEKIAEQQEIREILQTPGYVKGNLLHAATQFNKSQKLHEKLWEIVEKYSIQNSSIEDILQLINHCDENRNNILHNAVICNTQEIVEFTWTKIKKHLSTKDEQIEYLERKGQLKRNLEKLSLENQLKDLKVEIWIKNLMSQYETQF